MDLEIYILFILLLFSAFFSSAEIAFFSLSQARIRSLVEKKVKNASLIETLKKNPNRLLVTIILANTVTNLTAASIATVIAMERFGSFGAIIGVTLMTLSILFFGEIIPKSFAEKNVTSLALKFAPVIRILSWVLFPIVFIMDTVSNSIKKILKGEPDENSVSEEEVKAMVLMGHEEGNVEADEKEMIEKVFQLNDITAADIMTPEEYMVSFQKSMTIGEVLKIIQDTGHSRFPVLSDTGAVEGILYIKDVFSRLATQYTQENQDGAEDLLATKVASLTRPAIFIPENTQADELLKEFQKKRKHIGIVVDEHGNVQGLITLEDLLEEIVGEIIDESDSDEKMIEYIDDSTIEIDPRISIENINKHFDARLKGSKHKTIGWLVLKHFGRIPEKGDQVLIDDYKFIVEEADDRRMKRLTMIKTPKAKMQSEQL